MFSTIQNSALHITSLGDSDIYLHTETDGATHRWTMTHDAGGYRLESYDMGFGYMTYGTPTANNPDGTVWIDYPMTYQAKNYWNFVPVSNDLTLNEGAASTLSAAGISGTITWGSSNETVATVNASGVVTAVRAGRATVTARVNGAVQRTYNILVTIPDGQYLINHCASTYFLTPNVISYGTYTAINTASRATDNVVALSQIWNIKHQGGGYYTVSTIYKDDLRMTGFTGSHPSLDTRTTNDVHKWKIEYSSNGYTFVNAEYNQSALTGNSTNAEIVTLSDYSETDTNQRWLLTSMAAEGLMLLDSTTGERRDSNFSSTPVLAKIYSAYSLSDLQLDLHIFTNSVEMPTLLISCSDNDAITFSSAANVFRGLKRGVFTATISVMFGNNSYQMSFPLRIYTAVVDVHVLYDYAYESRYSDYSPRIDSHIQQLKAVLNNKLHVILNVEAKEKFQSYGDTCSKGYLERCNSDCGTCISSYISEDGDVAFQNSHHKNAHNVLVRLPRYTNAKTLAYLGYSTCSPTAISCVPGTVNGLAAPILGVAQIMDHQMSTTHETFTTIHEFGHLLGAKDHYGGGYPTTKQLNDITPGSPFNDNCIYGGNYDTIMSGAITQSTVFYCEGCLKVLWGDMDFPTLE